MSDIGRLGRRDNDQERGRGGNEVSQERRSRIQDEILSRGRGRRTRGTDQSSTAPTTAPTTSTDQSTSAENDAVQVETGNTTTSVTPTTTTTSDNSIQSLAKRYVAQYEKYSGRTLTDEQRETIRSGVESYYSKNGREERLRSIVFA